MKKEKLLDLYGDYLISSFGQATATGLSELLNAEISHAAVQRFLSVETQASVDLWRIVKPHVRKIESPAGVLIVDDSIAEKPYTKEFVMPIKGNRKVALNVSAKQDGRYQRVDTLELEALMPVTVYLEEVGFPFLLGKQVFTNEDGSTGILYLVTSDTTLDGNEIAALYQKRWNVEPYHKSLKQNASLEKSPTQTVTTQTNPLFAALCGYIKLELLKCDTQLNHFALKSKLYLHAIHSAYATLRLLHPIRLAA